MTRLSSVHREEQVKVQSAKRKRQSRSKDGNYPGKSFLGLYFCVLHFAFCLLTCSFNLAFALCVLPFDLFFQPYFCLLPFALCLLTFSSVS